MTDSLKSRLAALRTKQPDPSHTEQAFASVDSSSNQDEDDGHGRANEHEHEQDADDVAARLAALKAPSHDATTVIQAKNLDPELEQEVQDYLQKASALSMSPPRTTPAQAQASRTLDRLERRAPLGEFGSSSSTWSPLEIEFIPASRDTLLPSGEDAESSDELIKRFKDELSVEKAVKGRDEDRVDAWQDRIQNIKQFRPETGVVQDSGAPPPTMTGPGGEPPTLDNLEHARQESRARAERRSRDNDIDSDAETDESDSEISQDTEDSDSQVL
ncbi:hypothetical protein ACM66B_006669 [Microbotryomycetes sp. NB124-2]